MSQEVTAAQLEEMMAVEMERAAKETPGAKSVSEVIFCEALIGATEIMLEPWRMRLHELRTALPSREQQHGKRHEETGPAVD